jgi:hypothetical protein
MAALCCRERRFGVVSPRVRRAVTIVVAVAIAMIVGDGIVVAAEIAAEMIVDATIVEEAGTVRRGVSSARARSRGWIRRRLCCRE